MAREASLLKYFVESLGSARTAVSVCVGLFFIAIALANPGKDKAQALSDTFVARVTIALCPDYAFGNVDFQVQYRIGAETTMRSATVINQTINSSANTATVDISLPATLGITPFHVSAVCSNTLGNGLPSNELDISNCDRLALLDSDADGITNNLEDLNCDNFFSPGDKSNPDNVDTDGDGVRDLVEVTAGTDPTNPGSSPRPFIIRNSAFDPDGDGNANPVAWRKTTGTWYIKNFGNQGNNLGFAFGVSGDIPFTYDPKDSTSNVGVVRIQNQQYRWLFRGPGFARSNAAADTDILFGIFGDNILPGPWEEAGVTSPAVARLFNNIWTFDIYQKDGTVRQVVWGGNGDIPAVQDYDGDGLFDIAVFRPSQQKTYVIRSSDNQAVTYNFGTGTADDTVRGDYTGDGVDDVSFWEPLTGMFTTLKSDHGFDDVLGSSSNKDPLYYQELQLGLYNVHVPMSWNRQSGKLLYTVVDHTTCVRYYRADNQAGNPVLTEQWGISGDSLG